MSNQHDVAVIVGSLRKASLSRRLAQNLVRLAPGDLKLELIEIGELQLYNEDLETNVPPAWQSFRERVGRADSLLFITPEYNRSLPSPLKNAIDVGSRPHGKSVWKEKPAAIISISPGAIGAFGANHHLRQCLVFLDVPAMQQPEAYIGNASKLFNPDGSLASPQTEEFLSKFLQSFARWIQRNALNA